MHVLKVLSQISLCSPHRLITDDNFAWMVFFIYIRYQFFAKIQFRRKVSCLISLCGLHRPICIDTLRTSIFTEHGSYSKVKIYIQVAVALWIWWILWDFAHRHQVLVLVTGNERESVSITIMRSMQSN